MKKITITLFALIFSAFHVSAQAYEKKIDFLIQKAIRLNRFKLTPAALDKYVGEYEVNSHYKVKITRTGNQLFLQRNSQQGIAIYAYKKDAFFQKDDDIRISFKEENEQIVKITIIEGLSTKRGDRIKL